MLKDTAGHEAGVCLWAIEEMNDRQRTQGAQAIDSPSRSFLMVFFSFVEDVVICAA